MIPTIFNLKPYLDDPDIVALVALSVERPTTSRMEEICQMYQFDHHRYAPVFLLVKVALLRQTCSVLVQLMRVDAIQHVRAKVGDASDSEEPGGVDNL